MPVYPVRECEFSFALAITSWLLTCWGGRKSKSIGGKGASGLLYWAIFTPNATHCTIVPLYYSTGAQKNRD